MLKCVGYDKAFQQKVFNDMKTWVPPPKQEPKDPKKNTLQPNKGPKSRKRKRVEEEILKVIIMICLRMRMKMRTRIWNSFRGVPGAALDPNGWGASYGYESFNLMSC